MCIRKRSLVALHLDEKPVQASQALGPFSHKSLRTLASHQSAADHSDLASRRR